MRRREIGAALISAARTAAHTRGARTLYAIASDGAAADYFARFGFAPAASGEMLRTLAGTFMADYLRKNPDDRFPDAEALDLALAACDSDSPFSVREAPRER